ncbi:MAG: gliding motility-associated C-terminal domain-containing protein [Owenweeksia sp.]|nr:gliding motility-associated C-terminal domain-containing protein [Owenweeksia sp.]
MANTSTATNIGCQLYMPNAFTPNGDNINERFVITYRDNCRMVNFNMKIFDRWGRLVFETNTSDRESAWDGTSEGRKHSKGVYLYDVQATVEPFNGSGEIKKINRQGTVVLHSLNLFSPISAKAW